MSRPDRATETLVRQRAQARCEYCHFPAILTDTPFQIDHVIAEKHGGPTEPSNLAFACYYCNTYKGPNIAGIDGQTGEIAHLFNPRIDDWLTHFSWNGPVLSGLTPIGRATVDTLRMNHPDAIASRATLMSEGERFV